MSDDPGTPDSDLDQALSEEPAAEELAALSDHTQVGDLRVRLAPPSKFSICQNVLVAYSKAPMHGIFAALGLCWRSPMTARPPAVYAHDAVDYGAQVMDHLVDLYPWEDLVDAAALAYSHVAQASGNRVLTRERIASAVDFTEPPAGG